MKKILLVLGLILVLILAGCKSSEPVALEPTCTKPYFEYQLGVCCLDLDNNKVCDSDEKDTIEPLPIAENKELTCTSRIVKPYFSCESAVRDGNTITIVVDTLTDGVYKFKNVELDAHKGCDKILNFQVEGKDSFNVKMHCPVSLIDSDLVLTFEYTVPKEDAGALGYDSVTVHSRDIHIAEIGDSALTGMFIKIKSLLKFDFF